MSKIVTVHMAGYYNNQMRRADVDVQMTEEMFCRCQYDQRAQANILRQYYPDCQDYELPISFCFCIK